MFLASTYDLGDYKMSSLSVGLRISELFCFSPCVNLHACGHLLPVSLDSEDWTCMCQLFSSIEDFFENRRAIDAKIGDEIKVTANIDAMRIEIEQGCDNTFSFDEETFAFLRDSKALVDGHIEALRSAIPRCNVVLDKLMSYSLTETTTENILEMMVNCLLRDTRTLRAALSLEPDDAGVTERLINEMVFPDCWYLSTIISNRILAERIELADVPCNTEE